MRLDAAQTASALPFDRLADALAEVLILKRRGGVSAPPRLHMPLPGGVLLVMPATDHQLLMVKRITVHSGNPGRGLPAIQGEVTVSDAATGKPLFELHGPTVTARRTAALSLLAARLLAKSPTGPLVVVGAGVQARTHALAFHEGLGVKACAVSSRTAAKAEALAQSLRQAGLDAKAVDAQELSGMLSESSLVVTATTATDPVIPDRVADDAFLAAVGSFSPRAAEIPAGLVRRSQVYVDDLKAAQEEAGDLIRAGVDFGRITPLEDVADGAAQGPDSGKGPVLFKSVGHALFDLAAARLAMCSLSAASPAS
ncbi:delta(1)-pyrroline-2-carboxylate reductase family protein [Desulfovibrio sulfodismutans]|uniref:Delta(1)-pyrroline-2-carboxylate reductase family protein n=2 Tax=Desulfolutivibrio sulfodismutans TaxID=63561 RepID=A0A7K3NM26_9BACT|nr:delta(1)-pyrroline-2-carboxylate reductase family protein [Desulfolutivibrio sulfodismutans]NDY56259.1 delta(1)-pyrroline-2-carboxylate reductase family protein [Desulfolutivibrio sulfodismutans]QLA14380.1 delta(1)-pyrroline-2-carboxylate reductase family protein [Desulfolutivibrio sulfodismutans DSM 3696]